MNQKLTKLIKMLEDLDKLYEEDPTKVFFLLLLLLNEGPLSDDELENVIASIGYAFHHHGEKAKVKNLMQKIRLLRAEAKKNIDLQNILTSRISELIRTQAILDYLRKSKQLDQNNTLGI